MVTSNRRQNKSGPGRVQELCMTPPGQVLSALFDFLHSEVSRQERREVIVTALSSLRFSLHPHRRCSGRWEAQQMPSRAPRILAPARLLPV